MQYIKNDKWFVHCPTLKDIDRIIPILEENGHMKTSNLRRFWENHKENTTIHLDIYLSYSNIGYSRTFKEKGKLCYKEITINQLLSNNKQEQYSIY